jgi:hypothetical protein
MKRETVKGLGWAVLIAGILAVLIVAGSRNLTHFDAALVAYTFATLFAAGGISYRFQSQYGTQAFGLLSGASLTIEKAYLMGKFARVCLRTPYIDYNGRPCMVSAAAGCARDGLGHRHVQSCKRGDRRQHFTGREGTRLRLDYGYLNQ